MSRKITIIGLAVFSGLLGCGNGGQGPADSAADAAVDTMDTPFELGGVVVRLQESPPSLRFEDTEGRLVFETAPGVLRLARVDTSTNWFQGFLGVSQLETETRDFAAGTARWNSSGDGVDLLNEEGLEVARIVFNANPSGEGLTLRVIVDADGAGWDQVRFRFQCLSEDRFYGLGGQSHAAEHRGETIPIRVTEQGLGKSAEVPESEASVLGHIWDCYFPLPYLVVARPDPEARAQGLILDTVERSRFLLCSEETGVLEIQSACEAPSVSLTECGAVLRLLPGPLPADVVRQYTDLQGRPNPVPRWAFGPWIAFVGEPMDVAFKAWSLVERNIAATTVWEQDWDDYGHPELTEMADGLHGFGLRVVTYFNTFLDVGTDLYDEAEALGYLPTRADGTSYTFARITATSSIVDLTNPDAWDWMADRLRHAWDRGVDGWMADYAEWVAPDMRFHDGRDGNRYGNMYTVDWARLNHEIKLEKRPAPESALFFSRSGYLGSNPYLSVVWAGDQLTSFDVPDGLASVIPYGTSLGLAGVSAYGHDIAGYTGIVSPPSTKNLYFRWTQLGAFSPIMRTHRGLSFTDNWNWDSDDETIDHFRRYSVLHLQMMPYLESLHATAMESGLPAMRHVLLEFPGWEGAAQAHHDYLLGPALFVAPVIEEGAVYRSIELPPGSWYGLFGGEVRNGPESFVATVPVDAIPVYLRSGGIVPVLPDTVRGFDPAPDAPDRVAVTDIEASRVEIWTGSGKEGSFGMTDGTGFELKSGDPEMTQSVIRLKPDGAALVECEAEKDPVADGCYRVELDGAVVSAAREGPGSILFGAGVTGGEPQEFRVTGGPAARAYLVKLYRPRP